MIKDVSDKKAPTASIATPALQFVQVELRKPVLIWDRKCLLVAIAVASQLANISTALYGTSISLSASCYFHITIFVSRKARIVKDILDGNTSIAGGPAIDLSGAYRLLIGTNAADRSATRIPIVSVSILRFIQIEKRKLILI